MKTLYSYILLFALLSTGGFFFAAENRSPQQPATVFTEKVEVRVVQVDLDVIPKDKDSPVCRSISPEQIALEVGGIPRKIIGLHSLASETRGTPGQTRIAPAGRSLVFVFDEIFIEPPLCREMRRIIRQMCFAAVHQFLVTGMKPGDRVLLASIDFGPVLHTGWLQTSEQALSALDRIEKNQVLQEQGERAGQLALEAHDLTDWWPAWESLIESLGFFPGRKDVFLLGLGAAHPIDSKDGSRLNRIGALCQANRVRIHAVRIGENLFRHKSIPFPIQSFALASGGTSWPHLLDPHVVVAEMEEGDPCRFVLSFIPEPTDDREKLAQLRIYSKDPRFRVRSPDSFLTRINMPGKERQRESLFVAGGVVRGVAVAARLIPYSIDPHGDRWKAALRVRVRAAGELEEEEADKPLKVELSFWQGTKVLDELILDLPPEVAQAVQAKGEGEFVRPVSVPPGEVQFGVAVYRETLQTFGSARGYFDFPKLPCREGQAWWTSDKLTRVGASLVPLPALEETLYEGRTWVAGVNCREQSLPLGRLTDPLGNVIELPLERLVDPRSPTLDTELWIGTLPTGIASGTWSFTPPDAPQGAPVLRLKTPEPECPPTPPAPLTPPAAAE